MRSRIVARSYRISRAASFAALILTFVLILATGPADAMKIQQVKSPGGIEAWLVEEHAVPIIALQFAFKGGAAQDAADKGGTANFLTSILDEGAGELSADQFHERLEEMAIKLRFDTGHDNFMGSIETLSANRDAAFDLLRLAITKPRIDADAIERMRTQLAAGLDFGDKDPGKVASRAWYKSVFGDHPYGRPIEGTKESIGRIGRDDLEGYRLRTFGRDTLKISVVGDIDAKTLGTLLDTVFGALPAKAQLVQVPMASIPAESRQTVIEMAVPQSVAIYGHGSILRKDPDFIGAFIVNHIVGSGGFTSRLMEQVREKRGLAYSVSSHLSPYERAGLLMGNVATKNESIEQSLDVIRAELKRMADEGPTEKELADAKSYLTGSYPLRFDTSPKIAGQLLGIQIENLGIDYIDTRNALVEAVTLADARAIAKRIFKPESLQITIVGQPKSKAAGDAKAPGKS